MLAWNITSDKIQDGGLAEVSALWVLSTPCLKKLCQLIFCSFSVKYEPISIKIVRIVPEETLHKTVSRIPTSPKVCAVLRVTSHNLYFSVFSKCPSPAWTRARRRWRHSLTALSITVWLTRNMISLQHVIWTRYSPVPLILALLLASLCGRARRHKLRKSHCQVVSEWALHAASVGADLQHGTAV